MSAASRGLLRKTAGVLVVGLDVQRGCERAEL